MTLVCKPGYNGTPGKMTLAQEFAPQGYMYQFPSQYPVWTPAEITTALWLDAVDTSTINKVDEAVVQWSDKSGNSRNFTQPTANLQPIYSSTGLNGLPAISFVSQYLAFTPFNSVLDNTAFNIFFAGSGDLRSGSIAGVPRFYFNDTYISYVDNVIANWALNNTARIVEWSFDGINQHTVSINGTSTATATKAVSSGFQTFYQIGRAGNDSSNGFFAEYIFVSGTISTNTRQRIEGYLAHKWGLTANLPSDHPYKLVGPTS